MKRGWSSLGLLLATLYGLYAGFFIMLSQQGGLGTLGAFYLLFPLGLPFAGSVGSGDGLVSLGYLFAAIHGVALYLLGGLVENVGSRLRKRSHSRS